MHYIETARKYIQAGFGVIRLQVNGTKAPIGEFKPYRKRFATEHELREWYGNELEFCARLLVT